MYKRFVLTAAIIAAPGILSAATVFTDSFEFPVNDRNWQVYQDFDNWTSSGANTTGIEIQTSGVVVNAHDGDQYVELDSDTKRGGVSGDSNSSMTRELDLKAGSYRLEWYYQPRTNRANDNLISVYLDGKSDDLMTNLIGSENGTGRNGWERIVYNFSVDGTDNKYALTFAAGGVENTLGGFIDSVTLSQVPVPAAGFLLLGAFGGLAGLKRRKKTS